VTREEFDTVTKETLTGDIVALVLLGCVEQGEPGAKLFVAASGRRNGAKYIQAGLKALAEIHSIQNNPCLRAHSAMRLAVGFYEVSERLSLWPVNRMFLPTANYFRLFPAIGSS
jgi:hypothetical protein